MVVGLKRIVDELPDEVLVRLYLPYGGVPYRPKELLAVWLFSLMQGERSTRRLQERIRWDLRYRYLAGNQLPDDRTLGRFLLRMEPALAEVFAFILDKLVEAGLASRRCLAVDGTKIPGNVSQLKTVVKEAIGQSDPDARLMGKGRNWVVGYNAQIAVDTESGYVAGSTVLDAKNDSVAMGQVVEAVQNQSGELPEQIAADSGYDSSRNLQDLADRGIQSCVAPKKDSEVGWSMDESGKLRCPAGHCPAGSSTYRNRHGTLIRRLRIAQCPNCELRARCASAQTQSFIYPADCDPRLRLRNRRRARSDTGKALLGKRKTVERTFGHVKWNLGFTRFHLRGLQKARLEFGMTCLAYNLKRYLAASTAGFWRLLAREMARLASNVGAILDLENNETRPAKGSLLFAETTP
jgi:transposase